MFLLLALVVVILGIVFGYLWWTEKWNHWEKKGVKTVKPSFPYGNTKGIFDGKESFGDFFDGLIRKFPKEALIGFYSFHSPMLLVSDPKLIKQVLSQDFSKFVAQGFTLGSSDRLMNGISFWQTEHKLWKEYRSRFTQSFTISKQKSMVPIMLEATEVYMDKLTCKNKDDQLTVTEMINFTLNDSALRIVLGIEVDLIKVAKDPENDLSQLLRGDIFASSAKETHLLYAASHFAPWLHKIKTMRVLSKEMNEFYIKFFRSVVEQRKSSPNSRDDILNALIHSEKKIRDEGGVGFNDIQWASNLMTVMVDSRETTCHVMHTVLLLIAQHPEEQERMRQEIRQVGKRLNDFDYDKIQSLKRLEMVIFECLRLHPPLYAISRVAGETTTLGGVVVDKGTRVFIPLADLNWNPKYHPNPMTFNPDRFADGAIQRSGTLLPFGDGPRACLGQRYALLIMKILLIGMLLEHVVELGDGKLKYTKKDPMNPFLLKFVDDLTFKLIPVPNIS